MKPESELVASQLMTALKEMLRQRRVGYQQIADEMGLSLSSVKRMLNKTNLPLQRLLGICAMAGIKPAELFEAAEKNQPQHFFFTEEQDGLFAERPEFLSYFMRVAIEGESPDEIAAKEGLSELSTARYLQGLERVGLWEREVGNKVRLKVSPPFGFSANSKVLRTKHAAFIKETVEAVLAPNPKDVFALLKPLRLSRDSFAEMLKELTKTVDKYSFLSESPKEASGQGEEWRLSIAAGSSRIGEREAPIRELEF